MTEKFCRDCRFAERPKNWSDGAIDRWALCQHPAARFTKTSLVTGLTETKQYACSQMRSNLIEGGCGREGRLWERIIETADPAGTGFS